MAKINTMTATPCGPTPGTYEISVGDANGVPANNLAAVEVAAGAYACCTIDRTQVNQTPESQVCPAQDSGYKLSQCTECDAHW